MNFCLFCCLVVQKGAISFRLACAYKFFSIPFERGSLDKQFSVLVWAYPITRQRKKSMPLLDTSIKELFLILGKWVKHDLSKETVTEPSNLEHAMFTEAQR